MTRLIVGAVLATLLAGPTLRAQPPATDPEAFGDVRIDDVQVRNDRFGRGVFKIEGKSTTRQNTRQDGLIWAGGDAVLVFARHMGTGRVFILGTATRFQTPPQGKPPGYWLLDTPSSPVSPRYLNGTYDIWCIAVYVSRQPGGMPFPPVETQEVGSAFRSATVNVPNNPTVLPPGGVLAFNQGQPVRSNGGTYLEGSGTSSTNAGFVLGQVTLLGKAIPTVGGVVRRIEAGAVGNGTWVRGGNVPATLLHNVYVTSEFRVDQAPGAPQVPGASPHVIAVLARGK